MKGKKRISLLAALVCIFALVFSLGIMSACGNTDNNTTSSNQWYYGAEVPADTLGHEGDYYLNTETLTAYAKSEDGTWTQTAANWYYGTEEPVANLGAENDFYLNTESGALYQKKADDWGSPILTLKGEQGKPGRDGVLWYSNKGNPNELKDETALAGSYVGDFYLDTESFEVYQKTSDTKWELLGSIMGRGTTWFDGTLTPEKADLKDVYEGDYYYRTFIDDEAKAEKYQIYRFENKAWTLKADVITADLSALYASDGESYFNDNGDSVTVTHVADGVTELTIPGQLNGKPVKIAANAFENNKELESVTIEKGVTEIGSHAFDGCSNLKNVTIPDTVTAISSYSFNECTSLRDFSIPDTVISIGAYAFYDCYSMTRVDLSENSALTSIGTSAFSRCFDLTSIVLPENVSTINADAFKQCYRLVEIYDLSSKLTPIKGNNSSCGGIAYYALTIVSSADIPSKVKTDNDGYVFYEDGANTYLIGYQGNATELVLPDKSADGNSYKIYKSHALYNLFGVTSITLPDDITEIPTYMVQNCPDLTEIIIPETVISIGLAAFNACTSLTSITIPAGVKTIDSNAFTSCRNLATLKINGDGTGLTVKENAFVGCSSLKNITFGGTGAQFESLLGKANFLSHLIDSTPQLSELTVTVNCNGDETLTYLTKGGNATKQS